MIASPSIRQIASSLAQVSVPERATNSPLEPLSTRTPSRVLAIQLETRIGGALRASNGTDGRLRPAARSMKAVAEAFLKFSPRVQLRGDSWVFADIASTSHLFLGEDGLLRSAESLAKDLGFSVRCAIADTPAGAQAFALARPGTILPPGEERARLKELSLPLVLHLEGLEPWPRPSAVESIVSFFLMLGFQTIGDLSRFTFASFQERWGETGALLWRRLNAQDRQVISPLEPTQPLTDFVHLDFPVSLVSLLLHQLEKSIDFLFTRLQGRRLFAQKLHVTLHCEYSGARHVIEIAPNTPSRNYELFMTLLENRLSALDLLNPVRDVELHIVPCPEQSRQLDFFEPRTTDQDKLQTLFSLFLQSQVSPGFYRIEPAVLPEKGWRLATDGPASPTALTQHAHEDTTEHPAVAVAPWYGESVARAPRPSRMLRTPRPLPLSELEHLKILSTSPIERLEAGWWENGAARAAARDYYFAVSPEGQCLWVFRDSHTGEHFLHGYFD